MPNYPEPSDPVIILPTLLSTLAGQPGVVTAVDDDRDVIYVEVAGQERPFLSCEVQREQK